jgi:hypothetical protein
LFVAFSTVLIRRESGCKDKTFYFKPPNVFGSFFKKFRAISMSLQDSCLASLTSPYAIHLNSLIMFAVPFSLECGCKSSALQHTLQTFCKLFLQGF